MLRQQLFYDLTENGLINQRLVLALTQIAQQIDLTNEQKQHFLNRLIYQARKLLSVWTHFDRFRREVERLKPEAIIYDKDSPTASGAKFSRRGLDALMRDVRRGRIDAVIAYKLDRLGRSLPHLAQLIGEMTSHGVALIVPVQGIDTNASKPASQLQLNILMAVAEFEREIIRERVNAGLRAARARGKRLGRPSTLEKHLPRVRELRQSGMSIAAVSRTLSLAYSSAHKLVSLCNSNA
jgi:putative DNA-invertase from lambdoid prophage Rac